MSQGKPLRRAATSAKRSAVRLHPAIVIVCLTAAAASAEDAMPEKTPFAPRPFVLTPETPPEVPQPEKFWGEPMPANPAAEARAAEAIVAALTTEEESVKQARVMELFIAVTTNDTRRAEQLLASGVPVDSTLPLPAPEDFVARFRDTKLHYFVTVERGVTPLMLAAGLGHAEMVALLVGRGASPSARTKRHRTFALWLAGRGQHVAVMQMLLGVTPESDAARSLIEVDLSAQTAQLLRDGVSVRSVPISSGRRNFATPAGEYVVTDKHRKWRSTIYPAEMPFFMRLSCGDFGFHAGHLPGYPASHGCIRLKRPDAEALFKEVPVGTRVVIR